MRTRFTVLVGTALVALLAISSVAWAAAEPLAVTKTVPASGQTSVAPTANINAYFNHDMRASTVTSATFKIRKQGTTTWLEAVRAVNNSISPTSTNGSSQSMVTLNPNTDLAPDTTYQVVISGGRAGVKDVGGQALTTNKSWTFTTVGTPPDTTIDSGPVGPVASDSANFTFSSSESGSTFRCSLDGAAFAGCASPENYSGLSQGSRSFRVRAIDAAGNADPTPAVRRWTVDTIGPDASITDGPPSPSDSRSATFTFTGAEEAGSYQCKIDGPSLAGTFSACTSGQSFTVNTDGTYTFSVRASDALGNFGTPTSHTWTVDTTAVDTTEPTVNSVTPGDGASDVAVSQDVTAAFSEDMDPSTVTNQSFTLSKSGSLISAQVTYDEDSRIATLDPDQHLEADTVYEAKITTSVKDSAGNAMITAKTWSFTAPSGILLRPDPLDFRLTLFECPFRTKNLKVINNTPDDVTFADVSITGTDSANFSDAAKGYLATNGPFTVLAGNYFFDPVTFRSDDSPTGRNRQYSATLSFKDGTGATIGDPLDLTATTTCLNVG